MNFGAPLWLCALVLIPVLFALFIFNTQKIKSLLEKIVAPRLVAQLASSVSWPRRWLRFSLQLAALTCVVAALARPQFGYTWEESKTKGRDVLIVIDVSKSMLSTDATPNRLTRAKLAAQDLTNLLQGDRVGVVAFAGDAFLQAPLTADSGAVLDSIQELDTNIIPVGGTNIADAVRIAADAFGKGESDNRAIVLFSDGEEIDADGVAAVRKNADSFRVFTVGVGTANGSLIPLPDGPGGATFVKDENGQFVKSRLDEARLRKLAEAGDGFYTHLESGPADMKKIVSEGLQKMSEHEIDAKMSRHPIERYQWPLGFGLALLAASLLVNDRRRTPGRAVAKPARVLVSTAMAVFLAMPVIASASSAGMELYSQQKYKEATDAFQKDLAKRGDLAALNYDLGAAAYKAGDYEKALEAFSKALAGADAKLQPKTEYNLANTLYQRGTGKQEKDAKIKEWRGALDHYEQALKLEPQSGDAKYNRDLVKKLIEELEKEQKQQEQKKDQKQDQKKQQQKDDKQSNQKQDKNQRQSQKDKEQQGKGDKDSQQQQPQQDAKNQDQKNQNGDGEKKDSDKQQQEQSGKDKNKDDKNGEQKKQDGSPQDQQRTGDNSKQDGQQSPQQKADGGSTPPPSDKKFSGDVHAAQPQDKKDSEQPQQAEAAEAEVKEGEMSKSQALSVLESSKAEDERVILTERKRATRVTKDW